jgi:ABC-type antimicrobial peptide transport system permease subunit
MTEIMNKLTTAISETMTKSMSGMADKFANAISFDQDVFARAFTMTMDEDAIQGLMMTMMSSVQFTYDSNLRKLGYTDMSKPTMISIYPKDFESKETVIKILDSYNERMKEEDEDKVITYTDIVGALMSSVTDIVNKISAVLVAFVAISLIVSSIMIGVITYISVLERKKEIGILRSIGASKRDISRVFNAETVIEGLVSGVMGVGLTALGTIPANIIVEDVYDVERIARLPISAALVLVGVSVALSFVAGLIPSHKAAKADPVEALRSE